MDNKKIGNLIAELRKKQGLTQQDLGDKVGVGFRAVSKWERGLTLPDISIINELSKILGISSDELLTGELKNKEEKNIKTEIKKKTPSHILITISIITAIIIIFTSLLIYNNSNKTYTYKMSSAQKDEYYIEGTMHFNKENVSVTISEIDIRNSDFTNTIITNYEYSLSTENKLIFGYGYVNSIQHIEKPISIQNFFETTNISFDAKTKLSKDEITSNNLYLTFVFLDEDNNEIVKELIIELKQAE